MKFPFNGQLWYIDKLLFEQLNSIMYNIKNDWDTIILITGNRTVRVGKSVLAMSVCACICYILNGLLKNKGKSTKYTLDNIFFDNKRMMNTIQEWPPFSIVHYDEGREGLAASKTMKEFQQDLLDFFAECGQLNHVFVIVMPDFFELKEDIAVPRSEILLNVYRKDTVILRDPQPEISSYYEGKGKLPVVRWDRGYFEFFNRKRKQTLYDIFRTTRRKSYRGTSANFVGRFTNQYPLGEEEYRERKKAALSRFKERKEEEKKPKITVQERKYLELLQLLSPSEIRKVSVDAGRSESYFRDSLRRLNELGKRRGGRGGELGGMKGK